MPNLPILLVFSLFCHYKCVTLLSLTRGDDEPMTLCCRKVGTINDSCTAGSQVSRSSQKNMAGVNSKYSTYLKPEARGDSS